LHVQDPPFAKLGVLDVDTVIPQSERVELAKKLNHLISAPSFQSWTEGQTLEIPSLLYTGDGYPCTSIFYIAHLSEAEQQFIVTLLLENVLSWMSTLSGSSSLRAVVYIDEVFGMFPPHPHQPTTKRPLMKLLKQARAFGIGMVLGTQNAKDIDYKGLSNAGTWFIGKLQTENDRKRVLEGLDTASRVESEVDLGRIAGLIGRLNPREFILHNVHAEQSPILMRTRWAMSYLRGPLTKQQISALMANQRGGPAVQAQGPRRMLGRARPTVEQTGRTGGIIQPRARIPTEGGAAAQDVAAELEATSQPVDTPSRAPTYSGDRRPGQPPSAPLTQEDAPPGFAAARPTLPASVEQYFLPAEFTFDQALRNRERVRGLPVAAPAGSGQLLYVPSLLAQLTVRFSHRQTNTQDVLWYAFIVPDLPRMAHVDWEQHQAEPFDPATLELQPYAEAYYADIPPALTTGSSLTDLRKSLVDWVYNNLQITTLHNSALKVYSGLNESGSSFRERVQQAARQQRDEEVDKVVEKYSRQFDRLEDRISNRASRLEAAEEELEARRTEGLVTTGETALRLMRGQLYRTVSRVAQLRRYSQQNEERIEMLEGDLTRLMQELDEAEAQMELELSAVRQRWAEAARQIEEVPVRPNKTDITPALFGIGWVPYWRGTLDGAPLILPASSSLLCEQQAIVQG
ncbi:MAG TPA: hypothetical protein VKY39_04245, partial [Aggregatilineales bacterium]|nr:hypothetical protein [Aggregatilineales bacterium]